MPFPSTRVIARDWSAHHRAAAESTMTSTVALLRGDADRKNDGAAWQTGRRAGQAPAPAATTPASDLVEVYRGPAYLEAVPSAATDADVAGQEIAVRNYVVSLPLDAPRPRAGRTAGDRVVVLASPADPGLVGRRLRIIDVTYGSEAWSRDAVAALELEENNPKAGPVVPEPAPTPAPTPGGP